MCHPASCVADDLKASALGVIATVAQNNPYTQNALMNLNALPLILSLVTSGSTRTEVRLKALHATSCSVRNFETLENMFFSGNYLDVSHFTEEGVYVDTQLKRSEVCENGPQLIGTLLGASDIKLQRKAAFLLGALISPDNLEPEKLNGYYVACIAPLAAILTPMSSCIPEGSRGHGLDVDLREICLRTLLTFGNKGKTGEMLEAHGQVFSESKASAIARSTTGDDVENAQAEVQLWNSLFATR